MTHSYGHEAQRHLHQDERRCGQGAQTDLQGLMLVVEDGSTDVLARRLVEEDVTHDE